MDTWQYMMHTSQLQNQIKENIFLKSSCTIKKLAPFQRTYITKLLERAGSHFSPRNPNKVTEAFRV